MIKQLCCSFANRGQWWLGRHLARGYFSHSFAIRTLMYSNWTMRLMAWRQPGQLISHVVLNGFDYRAGGNESLGFVICIRTEANDQQTSPSPTPLPAGVCKVFRLFSCHSVRHPESRGTDHWMRANSLPSVTETHVHGNFCLIILKILQNIPDVSTVLWTNQWISKMINKSI